MNIFDYMYVFFFVKKKLAGKVYFGNVVKNKLKLKFEMQDSDLKSKCDQVMGWLEGKIRNACCSSLCSPRIRVITALSSIPRTVLQQEYRS